MHSAKGEREREGGKERQSHSDYDGEKMRVSLGTSSSRLWYHLDTLFANVEAGCPTQFGLGDIALNE